MNGPRKAVVFILFAVLLPVAIFFLGTWGPDALQRLLWLPAEFTLGLLESLCSSPAGSSFVCPYSQGQHNRLFFTSFYSVYLVVGILIAAVVIVLRPKRTRSSV
jgi:hypothetical protein